MTPAFPSDARAAARLLVEGLAARGLGAAVLSPGSRNAPLMQAFEAQGIPCVIALDERAAAHHALGLSLALNRPVAVACTSGTAALNHAPALAEANRTGLSLISLTADRPAGAADQWESQTLVQDGIHAPHVRASFSWSAETTPDPTATLDAMATAWTSGPIHVNCPFAEPLYPDTADAPLAPRPWSAPKGPGVTTPSVDADEMAHWLSTLQHVVDQRKRILLLGGTQPHALSRDTLDTWARHAILAGDSTSGLGAHPDAIVATDRWMRGLRKSGELDRPDLVITFGAPILSKALRHWLREGRIAQLHLDPGGRAPRAFDGELTAFRLPIAAALDAAARHWVSQAPNVGWMAPWHALEQRLRAAHAPALGTAPWCDLTVHAALHAALPAGAALHLANSTPVRYAQLFHKAARQQPWSNRGVAGIDGCTATAVGAALAGQSVTLISGDLGFLYDANAFHLHPLPASLRIAVIHNGGGGVFRWLPGPVRTGLLPTHFEMRHGLELRAVCDLHGLEHQRVETADALRVALQDWWSDSEVPRVLEIATPPEQSAEAHQAYMEGVSA